MVIFLKNQENVANTHNPQVREPALKHLVQVNPHVLSNLKDQIFLTRTWKNAKS